ncbi:penicillin-binding transpeptidase domain-containing protein [Haloimpatiens lingqiaonensis]|uniref:penicillin-binding transpeptidase domain-containing protein n=1 Tax=Haloimpatiens lingqiaonensis TaxID=1380675 RepID=UPI0010FD2A10|nr:penicillin-binding transpeptidase domain-containing protein [Haloimpatiens lingqiaonensis]
MQDKNKKKKFTRYTALIVCNIVIITSIVSRLVYLQIVKADEYKVRADSNYIRDISTPAPRGDITDRNGVILATSKQSFNLTYMETKETEKVFFDTMKVAFKILDENDEIQENDFPLKVNPFRFEFNAAKAKDREWLELRFKIDRGLADREAKKLYDKQYNELDSKKDADKIKNIHDRIMKISPEETFKFLEEEYKINKQKFSLEDSLRYMVLKDAVKMQSFSGYKPVIIAKNIKRETAFKFYERLSELPGIDVSNEPIRYYPNGELASSVVGYISKINSMDKDRYQEKGYDASVDYIGTAGIERVFENRLRGSKGQRTVKVNKYGRIVEELFKKSPYQGENVKLTIDANIQNAAEKAMDDTLAELRKNPRPDPTDSSIYTANATRGAAVAVDIKTGEILALVSRPGFDPNIFTIPGKLNDETMKKYFNPDLNEFGRDYIKKMGLASGESDIEKKLNELFPLDKSIKDNKTIRQDMYDIVPKSFYNYATYGLTPPGSTFKPLTAIAGLEDGVIDINTTVNDTGTFEKYNGKWSCWKHGGHGIIGVVGALKESCNYFFYNIGSLLYEKYKDTSLEKAFNTLQKYAEKYGLGNYTGIEIPEKKGGAYNFNDSIKNSTILFYYTARDILKNGYEPARNKRFTPIDINIREKEEDSNVTEIKKDIKKTIESTIKSDSNLKSKAENSIKYTKELKNNLKRLIDTYDKDTKSKYTEKDIENAAVATIDFCIWDANTQIYTPGNIINASIGQGEHNFTPVQLASYAATIANGGHRYELHLFKSAYDEEGNVTEEKKPKVVDEINIKPSTDQAVKEGMKAVTGEGGTATKAFDGFPIKTAGKTGTATFSAKQNEFGRSAFAVYVGYAPAENPEIAVAVVGFDAGHGGYIAPVARAIYEKYFSERLKKEYPSYVPKYNYTLKTEKNHEASAKSEEKDKQSDDSKDKSGDIKKEKDLKKEVN